jgi:phage tail sheath protein FI
MPFQLSPGVAVVEKDFTSIVPAVSTAAGAFAGVFQWGPCLQPVTINSENTLVSRFGKPTDDITINRSFFTAANFLSYTNNLLVTRADTLAHRNAVARVSGTLQSVTLTNGGSGYTSTPTVTFSAPQVVGGVRATGNAVLSGGGVTAATIATQGSGYVTATVTFSLPNITGGVRATGTATIVGGQITAIVITNAGSGYLTAPTVTITSDTGTGASAGVVTIQPSSVVSITTTNGGSGYTSAPTITITNGGGTGAAATATIQVGGIKVLNENDYLRNWDGGSGVTGEWAAKYPGSLGNSLTVGLCDSVGFSTWAYKQEFDAAPGTSDYAAGVSGSNDELHVIILDRDGRWTGVPGSILEKFSFLSKAIDAKKSDGTNNYYKDVINSRSQYIWWTDFPELADYSGPVTNWGGPAANIAFQSSGPHNYDLSGGVDSTAVTDGQLTTAWNVYRDTELYDVSLLPAGWASTVVANYVIALAEERKDCVAFLSPVDVSTGEYVSNFNYAGSEAVDTLIEYRNALTSSSYAVLDSGFKYQYDRYNDKYRWVPLNGDVAGLCARTDYTNDPWFSPGGLNRGQIKNVVKLAMHLHKTDRDNLYKAGINPVITVPGDGTVLFGDKTLLAKPSAFDRINVRRLFIVLEKAIATAAKYQLFELNDSFTRAQFKNLVEPFLRDVQGRRGITDFVVKCDDSNNTGEVIDRNEFVADIFIKPTRSINFISLNFVAARSGINFTEIGA